MERAPFSPRTAVQIIFFFQSLSFAGWFARIGDVQLDIGLSADQLGIALMGAMAGALLTYPLGPPAVERFGTRILSLIFIPLTALACALAPLAWDTMSLFLCIMLTGIGHGFASIAINVEADRVEGLTGRRIMNTCHGTWSLGVVAGTLIGAAVRSFDIAPAIHLGVTVPVIVIAVALIVLPMTEAPTRPHVGPAKRTLFARPTKSILGLIAFILASVLLENGAMTWSVIYFRDAFDVPEWIESLSLPGYMLALAAGRLLTDGWVERWGPRRVASVLSVVALIGLVPVAWAGSLPLAMIGFILIGFGMSCAYPLSISASARIGDRPASENVAAFSVIQRALALGVPAFIGFIAAGWGIAAAFAAMLPLPLVAILFARYLEPRPLAAIERPAE